MEEEMGSHSIGVAMVIDDNDLARWKATFAKDGIKYDTDDEYREAINNLVGFFEILIEIDQKQKVSPSMKSDTDQRYLLDKDGNKIIL